MAEPTSKPPTSKSFASLRESLAAMQLATIETEVLRVAAVVEGADAEPSAVRAAVLDWFRERVGEDVPASLPPAAFDHESFSWEGAGARCDAVRVLNGDAPSKDALDDAPGAEDLWALRAECGGVEGAVGSRVTEVVVAAGGSSPLRLHARLLATHGYASSEAPGVVAALASTFEMTQFGDRLRWTPLVVRSSDDAENVANWLIHPSRRLPVIALSVPDDAKDPYQPLLDPVGLARDAAGIAQVIVLPSRFTWHMTQKFSQRLSVYRGAVRIYQPGFDGREAGDSHWAVMARSLEHDKQHHRAEILRRVCQRSVTDQEAGPSFEELRKRAGLAPPRRPAVVQPAQRAEPPRPGPPRPGPGASAAVKENAGSPPQAVDLGAAVGGRGTSAPAPAESRQESAASAAGAVAARDAVPEAGDRALRADGERQESSAAAATASDRAASEAEAEQPPPVAPASRKAEPGDAPGADLARRAAAAKAASEAPEAPAARPPPEPVPQAEPVGRVSLFFRMLRPGGYAAERARILAPVERENARLAGELENSRRRAAELGNELQTTSKLAEYYLAEGAEAEDRAKERDSELEHAKTRIARLEEQIRSLGGQPLPFEWREFAAWCESELGGGVILSQRARREIKSAQFADVSLAARCVRWLATTYAEGRRNGAGTTLQIEEPGVRNERCGGDSIDLKWQGRNRVADWHIKNGGNTRSPARCLRIYYFWDEEAEQVVIASMPAHVRSAIS